MTALPGPGTLPGTLGLPGLALPPLEELPEDEGEEVFVSLSCCTNGSLLAKRLKDASWPSCTVVVGVEASGAVALVVVVPGCWPPLKVGAASVGVPAGGAAVVDELAEGRTGGAGFSCFMSLGTSNTSTPTKTTPSTPRMIFCFFCFALSGSTCFFAITELLS